MKLVYTLVLGTSAERREGSSPFIPTIKLSVVKLLHRFDALIKKMSLLAGRIN